MFGVDVRFDGEGGRPPPEQEAEAPVEESRRRSYTELPPGSVLWEEYSAAQGTLLASPSAMLRASRRASSEGERRWEVLHAGREGLSLRVLHLNTARPPPAALDCAQLRL